MSLGLASGRFGLFDVLAEGSFEYDSEKTPSLFRSGSSTIGGVTIS